MLVLYEFAYAFCRLAWDVFPQGHASLGGRLDRFVELVVAPALADEVDAALPIGSQLLTRRVRAVLEAHADALRPIFACYAAADRRAGTAAARRLRSLSPTEFVGMLTEGGLIDERLTVRRAGSLFSQVVAFFRGDGGEQEMGFGEFTLLVSRVCCQMHCVNQTDDGDVDVGDGGGGGRGGGGGEDGEDGGGEDGGGGGGGEPFEQKLARWLSSAFLPVYARLLELKERGLMSKKL
eukprot:6819995-Prymnesium_polylepis.1